MIHSENGTTVLIGTGEDLCAELGTIIENLILNFLKSGAPKDDIYEIISNIVVLATTEATKIYKEEKENADQ